MHVHASALGIVVHTPAKLNLFFEVLGKRNDGFHEIETLMVPIDLYDTLYAREDPSGQVKLDCRKILKLWGSQGSRAGEAALGEVPEGAANLVVRAVELLRQEAGTRRGLALRLVKRIPATAGLGGGSSDAAAALVAANRAWNLGWTRDALAALAAELGSDVPFFLGRQAAICRGRGERIEPIDDVRALHFVLARPPAGLSTAEVYGACRVPERPCPLDAIRDAFAEGNLANIGKRLFNRLEAAARGLSPWITRLETAFSNEDCLGQGMSGSGTCYFGLCRHERHARRVAKRLEANGVGAVVAVQTSR